MADAVQLDSKVFYARARRVFDRWNDATTDPDVEQLIGVSHIMVPVGDAGEEGAPPFKGVALQTWLLGYEFPSTAIILSPAKAGANPKITIITSQSKTKILGQLTKDSSIDLAILSRPKDAQAGLKVISDHIKSLTSSGPIKVGNFPKDQVKGKLGDDWMKVVKECAADLEFVDITISMSAILAPKDTIELQQHLTASRLCSTIMEHYFKPKMESIIDRESKVTHESFAALVEEKLGNDAKGPDMKIWNKSKTLGAAQVDFSTSDWIYTPIIQSGGKYDLKISAESNADVLKTGVILASMGIKYKEYCGSIGRTFLISPEKTQEQNYTFILELQQFILKKMKAGTTAKEVYTAASNFVQEKRPALMDRFPKNLGYGTGIDFRDSSYVLNGKNGRALRENMVFNLVLGFADLPDPKSKGKTYSLLLADTVRIGQESGILLTEGTKKVHEVVLDEDEEDVQEEDVKPSRMKSPPPKKSKKPATPVKGTVVGNKTLRAKTRNQDKKVDESVAQAVKESQAILHSKLQTRGLQKFKQGKDGKEGDQGKVFKKFESYKREDQMPGNVKDRRIFVDETRNTVLLPIYGYAAPFHISTIRNVSKTDEGDYSVLRINFQSPGQILGKKEDTPFEDPNATFVRSATFRSPDGRHMAKVAEQITNLRKAQNKKESDRKELADVVVQENLIELKGKRPHKLIEVQVRPPLDNKRNVPGELEIHSNGIRYYASTGQKVDLLFSNIKHLFFQPCDHELFVILHIHLLAPIMINGKKKAKDIQFVREISEQGFDETGNRKRKSRYGDEDEIEQEQEERKRRVQLNREFQAFAQKIADMAETANYGFEPDIPFRELAFNGVPFRSNVLLQPTTECLVHLTDSPFLVITLNEIEVVHLERVQFGLKNFDMVFVFTDFSRPPVHINSVPMEALDDVKTWLNDCNIATSEGPVNLSWPAIMKTINDDPYEFFKMGGWNFLTGDSEDEDDDSSEAESDFQASDVPDESSASSDDESAFSEGSDDDDEAFSGDDDEESGEDWDALEKKAERDDRKHVAERGGADSDDEPKRQKGGRR